MSIEIPSGEHSRVRLTAAMNPVAPRSPEEPGPGDPPPAGASPLVYLTWVLDALEFWALNSPQVDWPTVREQAFALAGDAATTRDTYPAIRLAIEALGDPHTFFLEPEEAPGDSGGGPKGPDGTSVPRRAPDPEFRPPLPAGRILAPDTGYLALPPTFDGFVSGYARVGADRVRALDRYRPRRWIVDLRNDAGGAIWPMLDVVAPLLGDGLLGAHVVAGGRHEWRLRRGVLSTGGEEFPRDLPADPRTGAKAVPDYVTHNDHVPHHPDPPVAVLTGPFTVSAGEAVLIACRGRPRTRTFGQPTAGLATANIDFTLGDDARLAITVMESEDRAGRRYDNTPIPPDVLVDFTDDQVLEDFLDGTTLDPADDPVVQSALEWLRP